LLFELRGYPPIPNPFPSVARRHAIAQIVRPISRGFRISIKILRNRPR
jgi:hypothetical protein